MKLNNNKINMTFHHVGVAVKSISDTLPYYTGIFGFRQVSEIAAVPPQKVNVCFVEAPPGVLIELVEGAGANSPVEKVLEKAGSGPYHICYKVEDLDEAIAALRQEGCILFKRFELPAHGLRRFAFLLAPDRQLFELCESDKEKPREAAA